MSDEIMKEENNTRKIISWVATVLICLAIAKLFTTFVIRSVEVEGASMSTTLSDGDKALTDALFYKMGNIDRFDIVIVKKEKGQFKGQELVKRVIALPGETIEYKNGTLYINDEIVDEPFIDDIVEELTGTIKKKTLGDNEYFVMGDNRGNSSDSRDFGVITKKEITGRGLLRFMECTKKEGNQCVKRKLVWPTRVI